MYNTGWIELDSGCYLNTDHIIAIEPIVEGDNKGGTMFFVNDPTRGLLRYEDNRSVDEIFALIAKSKGITVEI